MKIETIILATTWGIIIALLFVFVPRNKIREASLIFLFKQTMTWILGLTVVELGLLEYPVRSFRYATNTSFDFEYFFYPAICIIFNLHYPNKKSTLMQFMYYAYYCTSMSAIELIVEKYTDIITYIHWTWYATWVSLFITFYLSRKFYRWFFRLKEND
ncbi:MAG TPA: CBO0543 family protein [Patescibacteria group bacterium]|nr:CBO0543 family protein [Patescibacteria group bacterium]